MSIFQDQNSPEQPASGSGNGSEGRPGHEALSWPEHQVSPGPSHTPAEEGKRLERVRESLGTRLYNRQKLGGEIDGLKRTLRLPPYNQPTEREITEFRQKQEEERQRQEKARGFFDKMFGRNKPELPSQDMPVITVEKEPLPLETIKGKFQYHYDSLANLIQRQVRDAAARGVPMSFSKIGIADQVENISPQNKDVEGSLRTIRKTTEFVDGFYFHNSMDYYRNPAGRAFANDLGMLSDQENKLRLKRLEEMEKNPRLEIPMEVEEGRQSFLQEIQGTKAKINTEVKDSIARKVPLFMLDLAQDLAGDDTIIDPQAFRQRKQTIDKILDNTYLFYLHRRRTS